MIHSFRAPSLRECTTIAWAGHPGRLQSDLADFTFADCTLGGNCHLDEYCVLLFGCTLGEGCHLEEYCVFLFDCTFGGIATWTSIASYCSVAL